MHGHVTHNAYAIPEPWAADHYHILAGGVPVRAVDTYEHSYRIDFGVDSGCYVETFMNCIRGATLIT